MIDDLMLLVDMDEFWWLNADVRKEPELLFKKPNQEDFSRATFSALRFADFICEFPQLGGQGLLLHKVIQLMALDRHGVARCSLQKAENAAIAILL